MHLRLLSISASLRLCGNLICNQKGVSIIAVVATMLILSVMGVALISMVITGSDISINQMQSSQALSVAEAGKEYILENGTFPNYYTPAAVSLGSGNFSVSTPTWLTADPGAAGTTIVVQSTAGFPASGRIIVDSELIDYTGTTANSFTGATRGVSGTSVSAHPANNSIYPVAYLTADPGAAGTTISVSSTAGFVIPGVVNIESEYLYCTGSTAITFTGCQRGHNASTASAHAAGTNLFQYIITSTGFVGNATRTTRVTVMVDNEPILNEPFSSQVDFDARWGTEVLTQTGGSSSWDNNDGYIANGSLEAASLASGNSWLQGYRELTLSTIITEGVDVVLDMWFKKELKKGALTQSMEIRLVYSDNTWVNPVGWSDTAIGNTAWTNLTPATFTVPVGKTVDRVRLYFDIRNDDQNGNQNRMWFDDVSLTTPDLNPTTLLDFSEVY